jgi:hypothetical protein
MIISFTPGNVRKTVECQLTKQTTNIQTPKFSKREARLQCHDTCSPLTLTSSERVAGESVRAVLIAARPLVVAAPELVLLPRVALTTQCGPVAMALPDHAGQ